MLEQLLEVLKLIAKIVACGTLIGITIRLTDIIFKL